LIAWSISPFFFTGVARKVGPLSLNLLRLAFAFAALIVLELSLRALGHASPLPSPAAWAWLCGSGIVGLVIGDAFLYRAFVLTGPERTSQIQTLAPAATAAIAWFALREILSAPQLAGMGLILAGVLMATTSAARAAKGPGAAGPATGEPGAGEPEGGHSAGQLARGAWAAVWSALFQGIGTVMARQAFLGRPDLDPVLATAIRVGAGTLGLWAYARAKGPLRPMLGNWSERRTLILLLTGTVFGPVGGMLCYIAALKFAAAGLVTTITFMSPLLIIPTGARLYGTRVSAGAWCGTALSLAGVVFLGLG
jgi:drug/metabolite transporter (DMT)-like permease